MEEPSVLDYVKSKLFPWKYSPLSIPSEEPQPAPLLELFQEEPSEARIETPPEPTLEAPEPLQEPKRPIHWPWRSLIALALALAAQFSLLPRENRDWKTGMILYLLAAVSVVWASRKGEWLTAPLPAGPSEIDPRETQISIRPIAACLSLPLAILACLMLGDNRYTTLNVTLWLLSLACILWMFWNGTPSLRQAWTRLRNRFSLSRWTLLVLAAFGLAIFFRVYRLADLPPEMNSDHAEKLLDVLDVLNGKYSIFFPRNTGREDFQMYLTAAVVQLFGTGISFMSLKIGTVLCGLLTLPYIYLLGKEAGGRRAGLFALVLAGIAYWPNVISRIGLRFTLYPFFAAPTLYYLVRGFRTRNRNDFLLSGLFLGAGLHGYSPFRVVPLVVVAAFGIYLLHRQSLHIRRQAVGWLVILATVSLVVFLPLLRYALDEPASFSQRALSRMGSVEQPLPGPAGEIFVKNLWRALTMFAWDGGEVWVVSIPHTPALDIVSAALFYLGIALVLARYLWYRHWLDLFLLLSIPLLMLPSIMSLAFPAENPILNRPSAALVPVFVIIGLALDGLLSGLEAGLHSKIGTRLAWGLALLLLGLSGLQNYDLVFRQYQEVYTQSAWNTSEMGGALRRFGDLFGSTDTAWVVPYPHWVDTRLVGISAGDPERDFALWPENLSTTLTDPRPKLFLVKPDNQEGITALKQLYPTGWFQNYVSAVPTKDFWMFFVPPVNPVSP